MIPINYQHERDRGDAYAEEKPKKKFGMGAVFRWMIYSVCIFLLIVVVYRSVSMGTPGELKNYIVKTGPVASAHAKYGDDLIIYRINIRNAFGLRDVLFLDDVYYLESAETLQLTLRVKNSGLALVYPFEFRLKVSGAAPEDYIVLNPLAYSSFGVDTDRYSYFLASFDGVEIDYANSTVELYIFPRGEEYFPDEEYAIARFTIFDINMPKEKIPAKKFDWD